MSCPVTSSGLKTATGAVVARPCRIHGVTLNPAAAAASATIQDNASAASGTVVAKVVAPASGASTVWYSEEGVICNSGAYLTLSGASADCVIHYTLL